MERDRSNSTDRRVRVFVSSTFRDMHAERDHLVTVVFPELRERCERLGLEFFDVDLRWGVPEKDANGETANSWEYCKKWIDRVEPFFVSMIGQRYGYIPKPQDIRDENDRRNFANLSITEMEIRHAVLTGKPTRRSMFYLRKERVPENAPVEIRNVFVEDDDKVERLKTQIKAGSRPVYEYSCDWTGKDFCNLNDFGEHVLEDLWSGVLRDERYVSKEHWRQALGAEPNSDPRYTDESKPVPPDLAEKLVALAKPAPVSPLDAEREQMETFAESRLRWFQGRTKELETLLDFVNSTADKAPRLAVVAAVPGQGKSALLAKLWQQLSEPPQNGTKDTTSSAPPVPLCGQPFFLVAHFVGATERSASSHALVQRLLEELDRSGIQWPAEEQKEGEEPKRDYNSLCNQLANRLRDYSGERRIILLLDALNQLSDGHGLVWLPHWLGPGVRIVASCVDCSALGVQASAGPDRVNAELQINRQTLTPEQQVLGALERWKDSSLRLPLGPLAEGDVREIVVNYLEEYCKELDERHVTALGQLPQVHNPLYLLVMLGELRTLGGDDMNRHVPQLIAELSVRHPDTVSLFRWVLQRLEVFGAEAVKWWCLYLTHGRVGMASQELADLLVRKLGDNAATTARLIERGLRRYLQRRGAQLDFFHSQLRQAVLEQYGASASRKDAEAVDVHGELASYFTACAKGSDAAHEWETDSVRGFAECVFHLTQAGQHDQCGEMLTSFPFLLHKLRVGLLEGVFEDYELFRNAAPANAVLQLDIWSSFFREKAHILRRGNEEWQSNKILLQLAVEHADDSPLTTGAEQWLAEGRCDWLWFRRATRLPQAQRNPCQAVLEGHGGSIRGALALGDGRILSWSADKTLRLWNAQCGQCLAVFRGHSDSIRGVLVPANSRIISWSHDRTLRLWDAHTGQCLAVFEGHSDWIKGALVLTEGKIVSWSGDTNLRLWDTQRGRCLAVFKGHTDSITGALVQADGRIVSWSHDRTLRLWDAHTGQCLAVFEGHSDWIKGALALTEGTILSWSGDRTLRLWDGRNGVCLTQFIGHLSSVEGALALNDGWLLSWSEDETLRLWDGQAVECLAVLPGHYSRINGALKLADGRILSWARSWSPRQTLRLWDGKSGKCLAVLEEHPEQDDVAVDDDALDECPEEVKGAIELSDGRLLTWSVDGNLRLWDGNNGKFLTALKQHNEAVNGAVELADAQLLSWSDDGTLRLWDSRTSKRFVTPEGHSDRIFGAFALANDRLVTLSDDQDARVWKIHNGECIEVVQLDQLIQAHPEWDKAIEEDCNQDPTAVGNYIVDSSMRSICLRHNMVNCMSAAWNAESIVEALYLFADGTVVVTQHSGQVCILKLHHGNRRISLAEAEGLLHSEGRIQKAG